MTSGSVGIGIPIFLLTLFIGGGGVLLILIGTAIRTKKLWIVPAGLGVMLITLLGFSLLAWLFFSESRSYVSNVRISKGVSVSHNSHLVQTPPGVQTFDVVNEGRPAITPGTPRATTSGAKNYIIRLPLLVVLLAFVVATLARSGSSPAVASLFRQGWVLIPIVLVFGVFGLYFLARSFSPAYTNVPPPAVALPPALEPHSVEVGQARSRYIGAMNTHRPTAEIEQAKKAYVDALTKQRLAKQRRSQQKQIGKTQTDILAEIDQFDAPRIPLTAEAPEAPPAPSVPVQAATVAKSVDKPASDDQSSAKTKHAESGKPKVRPAWVDELPKRTGNTAREVITTDEYQSIDECYQAADIYLLLKTYQRIQELVGQPQANSRLPSLAFSGKQILSDDGQIIWEDSGSGGRGWNDRRLYSLASMGIGADYVRREIVAKDPTTHESREFIDTLERSIGPMKKLYLQIEFTPAVDNDLRRHWDSYFRQERLAVFSIGAGSLLAFLGIVFAMLKFDTATKGYYTKRLFLGVPAAIIGVLILLTFLDKYTSLL